MPAYAIFIREETTDAAALAAYGPMATAARGDHKFELLSLYGKNEAWEGAAPEGVLILRFADMEAARAWYFSDAYQSAKAQRDKAARYRVLLTEGV
jgi:uncharacterized protein (DUF1330 family)